MAAVVEFKYDSSEPDELNLQVGQIVKVLALEDEGWWRGELNGRVGMFPNNFVKKLGQHPFQLEDNSKQNILTQDELLIFLAAKSPPTLLSASPAAAAAAAPAPRPAASSGSFRKAKVTFDYTASDGDELNLRVGDIVTIIAEESEGWWRAELNGRQGMMPSNFAEVIEGTLFFINSFAT